MTGAQQGLYSNQHIVVGASGLQEATNLIARVGSLEAVMKGCEGWWMGVVEKVIRADGSEVTPVDLTAHVLKRRGLEAMGKGRKRHKSDGDKKGRAAPTVDNTVSLEDCGGDDKTEGDAAGPAVVKARVRWLAAEQGGRGGQPVCNGLLPMRSLEVADVISREHILYEQQAPEDIRWTVKERLYAPSLRKIRDALPKGLAPSSFPGQQQVCAVGPAQDDTGYNHAGVYVGTNDPPMGEEEQQRWHATLDEVAGFNWSLPREVEDPDPPVFEVVGLRRADGKIFATVETSQGDTQHDHTLESIRRRIFNHVVAERVGILLPLMMQWRMLRRSILILDPHIIAGNAKYYERIAGYVT